MSKDNDSKLHDLTDEAQEQERVFEPVQSGNASVVDAEESSLFDPEKSDVYFENIAEDTLAQAEAEAEAELELSEKRKKDKIKARKKDEKAFKDAREKYERDIAETNEKRSRAEFERINKENNNTVNQNGNDQDYISKQSEHIPSHDESVQPEKSLDASDNNISNKSDILSQSYEVAPIPGSHSVRDGSDYSSPGDTNSALQTFGDNNRDLPTNNQVDTEYPNMFAETDRQRKVVLDAEFAEQQKAQQEKREQNEAYIEKLNQAAIERQRNSENYKSFGHEGIDFSGKNQHSAYGQASDAGNKTPSISESEYNTLRENYENSKHLFKTGGDNVSEAVITQYKTDSERFFSVQRKIDQGELTVSSAPEYKTQPPADNGSRYSETGSSYRKDGNRSSVSRTSDSEHTVQPFQNINNQSTDYSRPSDGSEQEQIKIHYSEDSSKSGGSSSGRSVTNEYRVKTSYSENLTKENSTPVGSSLDNNAPIKTDYSDNTLKSGSARFGRLGANEERIKTNYSEDSTKSNSAHLNRSSLNVFEQNMARYAGTVLSQTNHVPTRQSQSFKAQEPSGSTVHNIVRSRYDSLEKKHAEIQKEVASYSGKPVPQALLDKAEKVNRLYSSIQSKVDNSSVKVVEDAEIGRRTPLRSENSFVSSSRASVFGAQAFSDRSKDNFAAAGKRVGDSHIKPVGTPFQGSPISKYDKLKIYNAHNYARPIENAVRGSFRALGGAVMAAAQTEQSGTANMTITGKERMRDAVTAAVAIKDLPRQLQVAYHTAQNTVRSAQNVGRFLQGKESISPTINKPLTVRQIDKQLNTKTNPFSSLEKEKLGKKFGSNVNVSLSKTDRKIIIHTAQNKNLKAEIKALQQRGSALSGAERKKLKNLMDQKKTADAKLRKLHGLKKAQAEAAVRNRVAGGRSKKSVEKTIKKNSKKGLRLSKNDKFVLSRLSDRKNLLDKKDKLLKAAAARKQFISSLGGILGKAARESEDNSIQGIMGASRVIQNRYVRSILKVPVKAALWPIMKAKGLAALGMKKLDKKLGVSSAVKKIEEKAVTKVVNSKMYKELNGGLYNRAKKKIGSRVSPRVKDRFNTGKKALNNVKDKSKTVKKKFNNLKERLKNSKLGKFASSLNKGFKNISHAFGVVKKVIIKVGISCGALLLVVVLLGAFITSIGGAASSLFLGNDTSDDGRIDLTSYINTLNAAQAGINNTVTHYKNDTEANGGRYNKVYVNYLGGANSNNYKEILSMAAVYFEQDFSNEEAVNNYIVNLFNASNYVTTEESEIYYCSGCEERTYKCTDPLDEYASTTREVLYYKNHKLGGCQKYTDYCVVGCKKNYCTNDEDHLMSEIGDCDNYSLYIRDGETFYRCLGHSYCPGHTKYKCDGHVEKICKGHIDLYVDVVCLGFDKLFTADPGSTVGLELGDYKQGDLIGTFKITYYCAEKYPHICNAGPPYKTASGTTVTAGRTIAVDPKVIPLGTTVIINGHTYVAEDTGGAIKSNRIDIAVEKHQEALNLGTDVFKVYYADEKTAEEETEQQVQRDVQEYLQRAQDASSEILSTSYILQVFGKAKEPEINWKYDRVNGDDENSFVAKLQEYDEKHKNEPWSNAEVNAFEYVNMSLDELKKLCKKRGLSDSGSSYSIITDRLIPYDKKHPDEYVSSSPKDNAEEFYFLGWNEENIDWAKNILSNMTSETYAGLENIGASTATGSLSLEGVTIKGSKIDVTYFSQHDSRWANVSIRNDYPQHTISEAGCGFTSMSIVVSSLTSNTVDPVLMAADYGKKYYSPGVGAYWSLVSAVSADYGLSCTEMTINVQNVINALNEGKLVVATVGSGGQGYTGNGYYKGAGHFLVICGVTNDGKFLLADPNNATASMSGTGVDMQYFLESGIKTWWAIGK